MTQLSKRQRIILALGRSEPHVHRYLPSKGLLTFNLTGRVLNTGEAGPGISLFSVEYALAAHRNADQIVVRINSEGGSVRQANKIYDALRGYGAHVSVVADKLCASAATIILMAGDFRQAAPNTRFLLHAPEIDPKERWTAKKHTQVAALLAQHQRNLVDLYSHRTGLEPAVFERELAHEAPMSLSRAKTLNLIHCVEGQETWKGGRPYYHPDVVAFLAPRKKQMAAARRAMDANQSAYAGVIFGSVTLSKAADLILGSR